MSTSKPSTSARPSRSRRATPPPAPTAEIEKPRRRSKPMRLAPGASNSAPESVSAAIQRALAICAHLSEDDPYPAPEALADVHRTLEQALTDLEVLASSVMRVRDQTFGDRRVKVDYLMDPTQPGSVLLRLVPSTAPGVVEPASDLIRTSEAAKLLGLSRPHVAMLCDRGELGTVEVTQGGQRRVARDRVLVYREERLRRRAHLDKMNELVAPLMEAELADAMAAFERAGWRFATDRADKNADSPSSSKKPARQVDSPKEKPAAKAFKGKSTRGPESA
ncbi:helix-turn-helix domain-containing protein [Roseateles sp. UC29_93]|uniref:helix-turn-helix domain-containing protein n=1 Tax=Roseateles sp. UC29_93 TaxID=3350177 RepID=UPI00366F834A